MDALLTDLIQHYRHNQIQTDYYGCVPRVQSWFLSAVAALAAQHYLYLQNPTLRQATWPRVNSRGEHWPRHGHESTRGCSETMPHFVTQYSDGFLAMWACYTPTGILHDTCFPLEQTKPLAPGGHNVRDCFCAIRDMLLHMLNLLNQPRVCN